jgi:hypothetical protein
MMITSAVISQNLKGHFHNEVFSRIMSIFWHHRRNKQDFFATLPLAAGLASSQEHALPSCSE